MTPEGRIQKHAQTVFKGLGGLVRKIHYEGRTGCPDLLVILPGGIVLFLEIKKSPGTPAALHQQKEHARIRARGALCFVVGSVADINSVVAKLNLLP